MKTSIFLNFEPDIPTLTHQVGVRVGTSKDGKARIYKDPSLSALEQTYTAKLSQFKPTEPYRNPVRLTTVWWFAIPKGRAPGWKTTKPDTDNLVKTLKDCMTACGFWTDDAIVCAENIAKMWASESMPHGIQITIEELS